MDDQLAKHVEELEKIVEKIKSSEGYLTAICVLRKEMDKLTEKEKIINQTT